MTRSEIYSHVCPTCGAAAGQWCDDRGGDDLEWFGLPTDEHAIHAARITLATPQPTEVQRFAERLAVLLDDRANTYADEAVATRLAYPGDIGRQASASDNRKSHDYREIAQLVREAAKGQP